MDVPAFAAIPTDYPRQAQRRLAKRRTLDPVVSAQPPYRRATPNRYQLLSHPRPATPVPAAKDAAPAAPVEEASEVKAKPSRRSLNRRPVREAPADPELLPISLQEEFERVRVRQEQRDEKGAGRFRKPKRPILTAIASAGLLLLVIAGIILGPVIYRGTKAYQDVFEEPVPRTDAPFVAALNPDGTSVIVAATVEAEPQIPEWNGEDRVTILLLGVDQREDEASRSDTMILVNIDPVSKAASMLAIPRDLKVIVPGYGVHKINAAYAYGDVDKVPGGGAGLTIQTIEMNFGIRVDYYAQVNFDGFVKLVDTVGGVTLDVPYPIKDDEYPASGNNYTRVYFQAGWQHMDGERVLQYARTRHDDGDGRRSARQQQVLLALREQAVSLDLLPKAPELLAEVGDAVRTDLQPSQAIQLARLGSEIDPAAIVQISLNPALTEELLPGQPYYLVADWDHVGEILTEFTGEQVVPPMSALANPDRSIEIRIEDGTFNPGLGARVADVLRTNGFENVTVTDKPDLGNYPASSITVAPSDLTTAYLIAGVLGIDMTAITFPDRAGTASAESIDADEGATGAIATEDDGETLVLVLGDDAPDPAYFTAEPFTDDAVPSGS